MLKQKELEKIKDVEEFILELNQNQCVNHATSLNSYVTFSKIKVPTFVS